MPLLQPPSPVFPLPRTPAEVETLGPIGWLRRTAGAFGFGRSFADGALIDVPLEAPPEMSAHEAALELLPDPVLFVEASEPDDLTGRRIVFANAAARQLFRVARTGAMLVSAVRHPEVLEAIDESLFGAIAADTLYEPSGSHERVWRVRTLPLPARQPAGAESPKLALVHLRDDTDARRAERMRVDFLANASHELRTPLASLSGFIETLRGHARDDAAARDQFLRIMSAQAERMARLIDDLMSLSRIELNEHVPPVGTCDLSLTVMDVADTLRPMTADKKVGLDIAVPPKGEALAAGDRDQLTQVVQNLIDNALKYAPAGTSVTVEVRAGLSAEKAAAYASRAEERSGQGGGRLALLTPDRSEGERYVLFRVADTGPGMAREHLPRLAERFYRVEGQKSGRKLGTGLGLAIAKHIVNRHRGGMVVESAPGLGAAFTIYVPMAHGLVR
jgi:two-component system phosphate regulon sensor histidine kinase PhoR